jgi:chromosome segregation ATPase
MDFIEAQEDKECLRIITDKAIRLSLTHMKDRMKQVNSEYAESKGKIEAQTSRLNELKKIVQDHEKQISSKVRNLRHMNQTQKTLILQLSDKTFEIESLQKNTSSANILRKIDKKRTRIMELTSECKMKNKVLESLQAQIQYSNSNILEKDKEIAALKTQRDIIQSENHPAISALKSKISELEIGRGVMKTRLRNHERFNTEMREEDSKVAKEIMNIMREKFNNFKHISESEMISNIDSLREKIIEKEQLMTEATLEYQDSKSKIAQNLRKHKEKITSEYRLKKEEIERERKKLLLELKKELRDKLFLSRVQQEAFFVEESELEESQQVLNVTFT